MANITDVADVPDFLDRRLRSAFTTNPDHIEPGEYLVVIRRFLPRAIPAMKNKAGRWKRLDATGTPRRLYSKPRFVVAGLDIFESDQ